MASRMSTGYCDYAISLGAGAKKAAYGRRLRACSLIISRHGRPAARLACGMTRASE